MTRRVAGLLLAAGRGRRMGQPKALLDLHGTPAVCAGLAVLAEGGCDPLAVVVGAQAAEVRAVIERCAPSSVTVVQHDAWAEGMGTSLRAGLRRLTQPPDAIDGPVTRGAGRATGRLLGRPVDGVVVHLVDQPDVGPDIVARLRERAAADRDHDAWAATFAGRRRTPVLFDAAVLDEVADAASGDRGARDWLDANDARVALVDCDDLGRPDDLDTPDDLAAYLAGTEHPATTTR